MAFGSASTPGSVQQKTASSTLVLPVVFGTGSAVGTLVVAVVAKDNASTVAGASATSEVTGVTDSAGNTWLKAAEATNSTGVAGSGATAAIWYTLVANALPVGGSITFTFSGSVGAASATAHTFSIATGATVSVAAVAYDAPASGSTGFSSATWASPGIAAVDAGKAALLVMVDASERAYAANRFSSSNWLRGAAAPTGGSASTLGVRDGTTGGGAASNIMHAAQFAIFAAGSGNFTRSSVSGATTATNAIDLAVVFVENPPTASVNSASETQTATSPTLAAKSTISVNGGAHGHASGSPTLASGSVVVAGAEQAQTSTSPSLAAKSTIAANAVSQSQAATSASLAAQSTVSPIATAQSHDALAPTVVVAYTLSPASTAHTHASEVPSLAMRWTIAANDAGQDSVATSPTLSAFATIAPDDVAQPHYADFPFVHLTAPPSAIRVAASIHVTRLVVSPDAIRLALSPVSERKGLTALTVRGATSHR